MILYMYISIYILCIYIYTSSSHFIITLHYIPIYTNHISGVKSVMATLCLPTTCPLLLLVISTP